MVPVLCKLIGHKWSFVKTDTYPRTDKPGSSLRTVESLILLPYCLRCGSGPNPNYRKILEVSEGTNHVHANQ